VSYELGMIWKTSIVAYLKAIHFPGVTEQNYRNLIMIAGLQAQNWNRALSKKGGCQQLNSDDLCFTQLN